MRALLGVAMVAGTILAGPVSGLGTAQATTYTYSMINIPGAYVTGEGINNLGQVVGSYDTIATGNQTGFEDVGGVISLIAVPGATSTNTYGINNLGQIAGTYTVGGTSHGFIDNGGTFTAISVPGAENTYVFGVNDSGQVVGYARIGGTDFGFIEAAGAFNVFSVANTHANGINNAGQVVGFTTGGVGFLYSSGAVSTFTLYNQQGSQLYLTPRGINDAGQISGAFVTLDSTNLAGGFVDTNGVLSTIIIPGADHGSTDVFGINDLGQVVGYSDFGFAPSVVAAFIGTPVATAVPEPRSLALLGVGLLAYGTVVRVRRPRATPSGRL